MDMGMMDISIIVLYRINLMWFGIMKLWLKCVFFVNCIFLKGVKNFECFYWE